MVLSAVLVVALASSGVNGHAFLGQPKITKVVANSLQKQLATATPIAAVSMAAPKVHSPPARRAPQTEAEKLEALQNSLKSINGLRAIFKKQKEEMAGGGGAEKFANGALSEELGNGDSKVWSTIESMLGAVQSVRSQLNGKSQGEQQKLMASLERNMDAKAVTLSKLQEGVSKKQQQQDEEYVLGLLLQHQKDWSLEKQLNATQTFMHNSPLLSNLFYHHAASGPLAPQLASLMDAAAKPAAAAKLFLQLASSLKD